MRMLTEPDHPATLEPLTNAERRSTASLPVIVLYAPAGNDDSCDDFAIPGFDIDAWARHADAANGFGDAEGAAAAASDAHRSTYAAHHVARTTRARALGDAIVTVAGTVMALVRRTLASWHRYRHAKSIRDTLQSLDDHALRDLGFHRSEIASIAAEVVGDADCTRVRSRRSRSSGLRAT